VVTPGGQLASVILLHLLREVVSRIVRSVPWEEAKKYCHIYMTKLLTSAGRSDTLASANKVTLFFSGNAVAVRSENYKHLGAFQRDGIVLSDRGGYFRQHGTNSKGFHAGTRNPSSESNHPVNKQGKQSWRVLLCALM
jgi:hypothetical protein